MSHGDKEKQTQTPTTLANNGSQTKVNKETLKCTEKYNKSCGRMNMCVGLIGSGRSHGRVTEAAGSILLIESARAKTSSR